MKDTKNLENKAVKPVVKETAGGGTKEAPTAMTPAQLAKQAKADKEAARENFKANRERERPKATQSSAFGDTDCGCGDA